MSAASDVGYHAQRQARWHYGEIAFWLIVLACGFAFPTRYLIMTDILRLALFTMSLDLILGYAGIVSLGDESRAAWTAHSGLVMPITEVIIHDMYIMEIMAVFGKELEAEFGPNLIKLRQKFLLEPHGKKYYLSSQHTNPGH